MAVRMTGRKHLAALLLLSACANGPARVVERRYDPAPAPRKAEPRKVEPKKAEPKAPRPWLGIQPEDLPDELRAQIADRWRDRNVFVDVDGMPQPAPAPRFSVTQPEPPR